MFDENGLRKVEVGFSSNAGILNKKVGLADKYGKFTVQPIYDEIKLYAFLTELGSENITVLPKIFIGGCTQAKRDGKQQLLVNASGNKSANGTKVVVWTGKGSAPENAKIVFVRADQ
jgi:hypothetical protein